MLEIGLRLVAPNDVPPWVCVEGIHLGARVVGKGRGLGGMTESLGSGGEEKLSWTAVEGECDDCHQREHRDAHQQA